MTALIVIDLQNDFTREMGALGPEGFIDVSEILDKLEYLCPLVRDSSSKSKVFWVLSEYDYNPGQEPVCKRPKTTQGRDFMPVQNSDLLASSRNFSTFQKNVCLTSSWGAELDDRLVKRGIFQADKDICISKSWYSCFTETKLADYLREFERVLFCGVRTDVCVRASLTDAFYVLPSTVEIRLLSDCCSSNNPREHEETLEYFQSIVTSSDFV